MVAHGRNWDHPFTPPMAQQPSPQQYSSVHQTSEPVFLTAMPANIRSPSSRPFRATAQLGSITQGVASGAIGAAYGPYSVCLFSFKKTLTTQLTSCCTEVLEYGQECKFTLSCDTFPGFPVDKTCCYNDRSSSRLGR